MKHTSVSLCARSEKALSTLSDEYGVSRSEIVRRLCVHAHEKKLESALEGFEGRTDGRTKSEAISLPDASGRAPALGRLPDGAGGDGAPNGVEQPTSDSPEGDKRGNTDSDGQGKSILDTRLW